MAYRKVLTIPKEVDPLLVPPLPLILGCSKRRVKGARNGTLTLRSLSERQIGASFQMSRW